NNLPTGLPQWATASCFRLSPLQTVPRRCGGETSRHDGTGGAQSARGYSAQFVDDARRGSGSSVAGGDAFAGSWFAATGDEPAEQKRALRFDFCNAQNESARAGSGTAGDASSGPQGAAAG